MNRREFFKACAGLGVGALVGERLLELAEAHPASLAPVWDLGRVARWPAGDACVFVNRLQLIGCEAESRCAYLHLHLNGLAFAQWRWNVLVPLDVSFDATCGAPLVVTRARQLEIFSDADAVGRIAGWCGGQPLDHVFAMRRARGAAPGPTYRLSLEAPA